MPVTVLYRKDTKLDGSAPVWLYGYGAYGDTEHPEFGIERLSLVDRGFIYAIAHVRGGGEKGDAWHEAGRLANKANIVHGLSGRRRASGALAADRGPAASSPRAPRPAARWWARPSTCGPTCSVPSMPRCRSSTASIRCSTATLPLTEASFSEFGNPIEQPRRFRQHPELFALRERARPGLSADADLRRASTTRACPTGRPPNGWRSSAT